ncbi:MAG: ABC transporter substrate-binding protein [Pigmentiphaga sp.]|uniref:ABC transporter substrate-binding protein n=1 Tax=Pigmentiphaga sp. TaxID=1977564 RepID=UPI0029BA19B3|nr:ABC transporter substrate-binding protein [Pigmentiphaga sp.]MDX3905747.1 ABC transporter substrate-binding protein [Pigmentiphaga sp.]
MDFLVKLACAVRRSSGLMRARAWIAVGILAAVAPAQAAEQVKVRLDFLPYGLHGPFYLAQEKGWFKEKGLEVEIEDGNGTGPALALMAANKYDIAQISLGALPIARDKGMPVKAIAAILRKGDWGLVVDEKSGIKTPRDLEGKTILYSAGSAETPFIDIYLKRVGVDKAKVNMVNVDLSAKIASYMGGKGDAMLSAVPLYTIKGLTPRPSHGILFSEAGINVPSFGLVANEATIAKRPQVLQDFVAVFQRAWNEARTSAGADEAVAALIKHRPNAKLNPALMKAQIEAVYPYLSTEASQGKPLLWMPPSDWKDAVDVMADLKLIKAGTRPESIYTNQFVPGL